jgi:hypothetical protein
MALQYAADEALLKGRYSIRLHSICAHITLALSRLARGDPQ